MRNLTKSVIFFGFIFGYFCFRFFLLKNRYFNTDEFEHLHAAWAMSQGQLIYRDFFEHHGPLFPALFIPLFKLMSDPAWIAWAGRGIMFLIQALTSWMIFRTDEKSTSFSYRALRTFLFLSLTTAAEKSMEIRPDGLAASLITAALILSLYDQGKYKNIVLGILFGVAFLLTPKSIYPLVGISLGSLLPLVFQKKYFSIEIFKAMGLQILGLSIPLGIILLFFAYKGALPDFYNHFFLFNIHFINHFPVWDFLEGSLRENTLLWVLFIGGIIFSRKNLPLTWGAVFTLVGLFHVSVPYKQYYLLLAPFMAFLSVQMMMVIRQRWKMNWAGWGVFFLLFSPSFYFQIQKIKTTNKQQIEFIRCIRQLTAPESHILDAWSGFSFFRPHAMYYWMLHHEIQMMLPPDFLENSLLKALADKNCTGFIWDPTFDRFPESVKNYARQHFSPSGCGLLYLKNPS